MARRPRRTRPQLDPRARVALGRIVAAFLRAGWRPPLPSDRIVSEIADDIAAVSARVLTERQVAILELVALGRTDREIALLLGTSVYGVKESLRAAYRKLGARDRANAVSIALSRGLISPDL